MTTTFVFANNINTQLAGGISSAETTLTLSSTLNLPTSIAAGTVLVLTLNDAATRTNFEIVYVTAISGATLTVERAQEGTSAKTWLTGDFAFSGPTAGQMQSFLQGAASGVTPGSYGSSTTVASFTVNANGILTAASNTAIAFPITSFNGRAGAIVLNSGDVTTALGFTPLGSSIAASTLLGNPTTAAAAPQTITLQNGLIFSGTALSLGSITVTGVTNSGNSTNTGLVYANYTGSTPGSTGSVQLGDPTGSSSSRVTITAAGQSTSFVAIDSFGETLRVFGQYRGGAANVYATCNLQTPAWAFLYGATFAGSVGVTGSITASGTISATGGLVTTNSVQLSGSLILANLSGTSSQYLQSATSGDNVGSFTRVGSSNYTWNIDGSLSVTGSGNFNTSDETWKTEIRREQVALPMHRLAPLADYLWTKGPNAGTRGHSVIAQDAQRANPLFTLYTKPDPEHGRPDGFLSVDKAGVALEAAYWASQQIDALLHRVTALELRR